jgi:hypothetical protein
MKSVFMVLVILSIGFLPEWGCSAAEPSAPKNDSPANAPRIQFEEAAYDFGLKPPNQHITLVHDFAFRNTGTKTLHINSAGEACRTEGVCKKKEVLPGQVSTVTLTADLPADYTTSEHFERHVKVECDDPQTPSVELAIRATFAYTVVWQPEKIDLGVFAPAETKQTTITLVSRTPASFQIRGATTSKNIFETYVPEKCVEPVRAAGGATNPEKTRSPEESPYAGDMKTFLLKNPQMSISAKIKPNLPPGSFVDTLLLQTDRPDIPVISIPVSGKVADAVTVEPSEMFLGVIRSTAKIEKEIRILSSDPNFKVTNCSTKIPGLTGNPQKIDGGCRLLLTFDPTVASGPFEGQVEVATEPVSGNGIRVRVWGLVNSAAKTGEKSK